MPRLRVDHRHAVARRAGDEQPVVRRVQRDLVRDARRPAISAIVRSVVGIDDQHRAAGPIGDVQQAVAGQDHVVRPEAAAGGKIARLGRIDGDAADGAAASACRWWRRPRRTTCCPPWPGSSANRAFLPWHPSRCPCESRPAALALPAPGWPGGGSGWDGFFANWVPSQAKDVNQCLAAARPPEAGCSSRRAPGRTSFGPRFRSPASCPSPVRSRSARGRCSRWSRRTPFCRPPTW